MSGAIAEHAGIIRSIDCNCAAEGSEPTAQRARRLVPSGRRAQQIAASAAHPRRPVAGSYSAMSSGSTSSASSLKLAAGVSAPAALFGRKDPHAKRMFTAAEDAIFQRLHDGEISAEAAMIELRTSDVPLKRHYYEMFGVRLTGKRPVYRFTEADRPMLKSYSDGKITMTKLCETLGTSAPTVRKAMRAMGIALPGQPAKAMITHIEPPLKGAWIPLSHKEAGKSEWVPLDGAPMTIEEAHALRNAGQAYTAQRRIDGGFDFEVFVKAKKARR